jgi:HEPN domain-containing protein
MKGKRRSPDNPAEWLGRARSSLTLSAAKTPGVLYEDLCYQAQQAAEKALKAVFVSRKIPYPYTHDINALLSGLELHGIAIPEPLWRAVTLTTYASDTRYPGIETPVTKEEYLAAVGLALDILRWAEEQAGKMPD